MFGPSSAKVRHWIFWPTPPRVAALFSASGALDPNYLKRLGIKAITAAELLAHVDEPELWKGLLTHKSPDVRLRTLQYLTDRRDGKAKQAIEVKGGLIHAHTAYRDPKLAALSLEELTALDTLTRKLALPAPDGPQNQKESNTATEDAEMGW